MREVRFPHLRLSEVYLYRKMSDGSVMVAFSSLLHHVLDPRQGLWYWQWGVWAASLLGKLQDGHVAEWTHLPHLQPLNEAPLRKQIRKSRGF